MNYEVTIANLLKSTDWNGLRNLYRQKSLSPRTIKLLTVYHILFDTLYDIANPLDQNQILQFRYLDLLINGIHRFRQQRPNSYHMVMAKNYLIKYMLVNDSIVENSDLLLTQLFSLADNLVEYYFLQAEPESQVKQSPPTVSNVKQSKTSRTKDHIPTTIPKQSLRNIQSIRRLAQNYKSAHAYQSPSKSRSHSSKSRRTPSKKVSSPKISMLRNSQPRTPCTQSPGKTSYNQTPKSPTPTNNQYKVLDQDNIQTFDNRGETPAFFQVYNKFIGESDPQSINMKHYVPVRIGDRFEFRENPCFTNHSFTTSSSLSFTPKPQKLPSYLFINRAKFPKERLQFSPPSSPPQNQPLSSPKVLVTLPDDLSEVKQTQEILTPTLPNEKNQQKQDKEPQLKSPSKTNQIHVENSPSPVPHNKQAKQDSKKPSPIIKTNQGSNQKQQPEAVAGKKNEGASKQMYPFRESDEGMNSKEYNEKANNHVRTSTKNQETLNPKASSLNSSKSPQQSLKNSNLFASSQLESQQNGQTLKESKQMKNTQQKQKSITSHQAQLRDSQQLKCSSIREGSKEKRQESSQQSPKKKDDSPSKSSDKNTSKKQPNTQQQNFIFEDQKRKTKEENKEALKIDLSFRQGQSVFLDGEQTGKHSVVRSHVTSHESSRSSSIRSSDIDSEDEDQIEQSTFRIQIVNEETNQITEERFTKEEYDLVVQNIQKNLPTGEDVSITQERRLTRLSVRPMAQSLHRVSAGQSQLKSSMRMSQANPNPSTLNENIQDPMANSNLNLSIHFIPNNNNNHSPSDSNSSNEQLTPSANVSPAPLETYNVKNTVIEEENDEDEQDSNRAETQPVNVIPAMNIFPIIQSQPPQQTVQPVKQQKRQLSAKMLALHAQLNSILLGVPIEKIPDPTKESGGHELIETMYRRTTVLRNRKSTRKSSIWEIKEVTRKSIFQGQ